MLLIQVLRCLAVLMKVQVWAWAERKPSSGDRSPSLMYRSMHSLYRVRDDET